MPGGSGERLSRLRGCHRKDKGGEGCVMNLLSTNKFVKSANSDPFASPVLRSPVVPTPMWLFLLILAVRLAGRVIRFIARHPVVDVAALTAVLSWSWLGWPGPLTLALLVITACVMWRVAAPRSWYRLIAGPARGRWRRRYYRRRWPAVMVVTGLAVAHRGWLVLPALGRVTSTDYTDRIRVRLVVGQSPADFAARADNLAHGLGAMTCRIRAAAPGRVVLELVRRDALAAIIPALPMRSRADLRAVPVGRHEDGALWTLRLHGSHLLVAGSTGAGKASLLWGIVRGILPALADGTARILGADPKLMELAYGRQLFEAYGRYEYDPAAIVAMLEDAVTDMQDRAGRLAGRHRYHVPTAEHPFVVVIVDEVAFVTAYQPDRKLRERALAAIAILTTQGRAVGYCVVGALQDPRKDVLTIRNLFPDRIAMRLDEPEQVDMVLGDGARDRGALADQIPADPATGAGVAWVRLADSPDPARVRAAWVSDEDITAMCRGHGQAPGPVQPVSEASAA